MPLPNFFGNYFYGKSGRKDFTDADLPASRPQLFRDVLLVRKGSMVGLNLLYLLFWLPALFWTFISLLPAFASPMDQDISLHTILFSWLLILFPLVAVTGPFNMGVSFVLRNWARDEHSFVLSDFAAAVKANWKQGLLLGAVNGAIPLLVYISFRFYGNMADASVIYYIPLAIALVASAVWYLSAPSLPMMIATYDLGFLAHARNAILMTLAELPRAILIRIAALMLPILLMIIAAFAPAALGIASGVVLIAYVLFMLSFNKLMDASFANYLCEKYLNPRIEGAATNIGVRPENKKPRKKK